MGCCSSTPIVAATPKTSRNPYVTPSNHHPPPPPGIEIKGGAPPPQPVLEEETVKEVLSETPISKPPKTSIETTLTNNTTQKNMNPTSDILQQTAKEIEPMDFKPTELQNALVSEISETTEMCSFSGSFSTVTLNDKDEGEVNQRVVPRSPAKTPRKHHSYSGQQPGPKDRVHRSPAKRSMPSPVKRAQVKSRPSQVRTTTPQLRNAGPSYGARRDPASARRSRSPAPRGEMAPSRKVGYKNPGLTDQSGGRSSEGKVEEIGKVEKQDDGVSAEISESLENPHVSLECFIFL